MTRLEVLKQHVELGFTTDVREEIVWAIATIERLSGQVTAMAALHYGSAVVTKLRCYSEAGTPCDEDDARALYGDLDQLREFRDEVSRLQREVAAGEQEIAMLKAANPGLSAEPDAKPVDGYVFGDWKLMGCARCTPVDGKHAPGCDWRLYLGLTS